MTSRGKSKNTDTTKVRPKKIDFLITISINITLRFYHQFAILLSIFNFKERQQKYLLSQSNDHGKNLFRQGTEFSSRSVSILHGFSGKVVKIRMFLYKAVNFLVSGEENKDMNLFRRRGTELSGEIIKIRTFSEQVNNFRQSILDTDLFRRDGDFITGSFFFLSQVFFVFMNLQKGTEFS